MAKKMNPMALALALSVLLLVSLGCNLGSQITGAETTPAAGGDAPISTVRPVQVTPAELTSPPVEPAEAAEPAATEAPPPEPAAPAEPQPDAQADPFTGLVPCEAEACVVDGYFPFRRPAGENGRNLIDQANRYAAYRRATDDSYHGVFFLNSSGTPVVAAADGVVVVAGDDSQTRYASMANLYGSLVILQHDLPGFSEPVYTLYAHLSLIDVGVDDVVQAGDQIGQVGSSGAVRGSILYFEVRVGENDYAAVRNPALWMQPQPGEDGQLLGAIAGRVVDGDGEFLAIDNIVLELLAGPGQPAADEFYLKTYAEKRLSGQSPYAENFAMGDLPPGEYQVSIWLNGMHQQIVTVEPGKLTLVNIVIAPR